jgi:hypothetical protein
MTTVIVTSSTEAKAAAFKDLSRNGKPDSHIQIFGRITYNKIIVSGANIDITIMHTIGRTKIIELISIAAKPVLMQN